VRLSRSAQLPAESAPVGSSPGPGRMAAMVAPPVAPGDLMPIVASPDDRTQYAFQDSHPQGAASLLEAEMRQVQSLAAQAVDMRLAKDDLDKTVEDLRKALKLNDEILTNDPYIHRLSEDEAVNLLSEVRAWRLRDHPMGPFETSFGRAGHRIDEARLRAMLSFKTGFPRFRASSMHWFKHEVKPRVQVTAKVTGVALFGVPYVVVAYGPMAIGSVSIGALSLPRAALDAACISLGGVCLASGGAIIRAGHGFTHAMESAGVPVQKAGKKLAGEFWKPWCVCDALYKDPTVPGLMDPTQVMPYVAMDVIASEGVLPGDIIQVDTPTGVVNVRVPHPEDQAHPERMLGGTTSSQGAQLKSVALQRPGPLYDIGFEC